MRTLASITLGIVAYAVLAFPMFGGVLKAPLLFFLWPDSLGIPGWRFAVISAIAVSAWAAYGPLRPYLKWPFRFPAFVCAAVLIPTTCLVLIADLQRSWAVREFNPDQVVQNSLFTSLRSAPEELQLYLHAAALKDCKPYAWSYREMAFYGLQANVAVNVVPEAWIKMCAITRITYSRDETARILNASPKR